MGLSLQYDELWNEGKQAFFIPVQRNRGDAWDGESIAQWRFLRAWTFKDARKRSIKSESSGQR